MKMSTVEKKGRGRTRKYSSDEERREARRIYNATARRKKAFTTQLHLCGFPKPCLVLEFDSNLDRDLAKQFLAQYVLVPKVKNILIDSEFVSQYLEKTPNQDSGQE